MPISREFPGLCTLTGKFQRLINFNLTGLDRPHYRRGIVQPLPLRMPGDSNSNAASPFHHRFAIAKPPDDHLGARADKSLAIPTQCQRPQHLDSHRRLLPAEPACQPESRCHLTTGSGTCTIHGSRPGDANFTTQRGHLARSQACTVASPDLHHRPICSVTVKGRQPATGDLHNVYVRHGQHGGYALPARDCRRSNLHLCAFFPYPSEAPRWSRRRSPHGTTAQLERRHAVYAACLPFTACGPVWSGAGGTRRRRFSRFAVSL